MQKKDFISSVLIGTCLFTLVSCGSDNSSNSGNNTVQQQEEQLQDNQGTYRAVLSSLNTNVAGNTTGTVEITIEGDDIRVFSNVTGAPAGVKHLQNITLSSSCPTEAQDVNGDSYVDIAESTTTTGPILIPLDSDLSAQLDGMTYGPIANSEGTYIYRRSTTLSDLLSDLTTPDPDVLDPIVKLPEGQNLNLGGRVIIVHGVASSKNLPETVSSVGDLPSELSLPIACGKLVRVSSEEEETTSPEVTPVTTTESM